MNGVPAPQAIDHTLLSLRFTEGPQRPMQQVAQKGLCSRREPKL
jgi:hypothetical protein